MEYMIIICGIWTAMLPYMKWNESERRNSLCYLIAGLYTCISIVGYIINDQIFSYLWVQIAYFIMCIPLVLEIIARLKEQKAALDVLAIATSLLGLMLSGFIFLTDFTEISSAIIMVAGSMIILSIPFYRVVCCTKSEK